MEENKDFSNFEKAVGNNNKRAYKAGAIGELTVEELETAYLYFGGRCAYSGKPIDTRLSIEHVIPIMSGGHSLAFNCIPVINKYNASKSGYHLLDWWKSQTVDMKKSLYNPYRLLKVLNYMIKCLEATNSEDEMIHVLTDNEIDEFLSVNQELFDADFVEMGKRIDYKNISQVEVFRKMDMLRSEDVYMMYDGLDSIKIDAAIFFEEAVHELTQDLPKDIIEAVEGKIQKLPNIYIDGKKVFKKEMNPVDVKIRQEVLEWAEDEQIDNKYGIVGYMNFEVLKKQQDIKAFLTMKKQEVLRLLGANSEDFNNIINKVPNILTNEKLEQRTDMLKNNFGINVSKVEEKSSEMYRYIINKPDLILSQENMDVLLGYAGKYDIDKRLLKKGIPITTILDNLETAIEVLEKSNLDIDESVKKRIIEDIINNTNGNLIRDALKNLRKIAKRDNPKLTIKEIEEDASKWLICISEKYTAMELFKSNKISRTREQHRNMKFDKEGHLEGINPNAYIIPKIVRLANLKVSKEAELDIINNMFSVKRIRSGDRVDRILKELAIRVKTEHPEYSEEDVIQEASRWLVFLSEMSQVPLEDMFDENLKGIYMDTTQKYYPSMKFDDKGDFIDCKVEGLEDFVIGIDYMKIADSFLRSDGENYLINGKAVPKSEIQNLIYEKLSKCKNKKEVKKECILLLKSLTEDKSRNKNPGDDVGDR